MNYGKETEAHLASHPSCACGYCGRRIPREEMEEHLESCHELNRFRNQDETYHGE